MTYWRQGWLRGSIARAFLLASLTVSVIPIMVLSGLGIPRNTQVLTTQAQENLQDIAQANAETINLKLGEVLRITQIAAKQAQTLLQQDVSTAEVQAKMARYQLDERNVLEFSRSTDTSNVSNVYWDNDVPLTDEVRHQIAQTEALDPLFESIRMVSPTTQWVYITTPEGMMRLYPWVDNDQYPDGWDPREIIFYTVAEPGVNPSLQPRWTRPYVDYAGAGWTVTLSVPIVGPESQFLGIMSHDITINALKDSALNIKALDSAGYGFIIDHEGGVIVHPYYELQDITKGMQTQTNLLNVGSDSFRSLIRRMVRDEQGVGYFLDEQNQQQLLAFSPIPTLGWTLGIVVPRTNVVGLATVMRNETLGVTALVLLGVVGVCVVLTRQIVQPLHQLLRGVKVLSEDRNGLSPIVPVNSFTELDRLARAFNTMAGKVRERESGLRAKVAELTIKVDSQRQKNELTSIVESDYFKHLEEIADRLRNDMKGL